MSERERWELLSPDQVEEQDYGIYYFPNKTMTTSMPTTTTTTTTMTTTTTTTTTTNATANATSTANAKSDAVKQEENDGLSTGTKVALASLVVTVVAVCLYVLKQVRGCLSPEHPCIPVLDEMVNLLTQIQQAMRRWPSKTSKNHTQKAFFKANKNSKKIVKKNNCFIGRGGAERKKIFKKI